MLKKFVAAGVVVASLACAAHAAPKSAKIEPVAWRGGYRYRQSSAPATYRSNTNRYGTNQYGGNRGSSGRTSALDYPPESMPYASRIHQWNKYPNQPFYLRGERRSLGILP